MAEALKNSLFKRRRLIEYQDFFEWIWIISGYLSSKAAMVSWVTIPDITSGVRPGSRLWAAMLDTLCGDDRPHAESQIFDAALQVLQRQAGIIQLTGVDPPCTISTIMFRISSSVSPSCAQSFTYPRALPRQFSIGDVDQDNGIFQINEPLSSSGFNSLHVLVA
jgi:hypothetical protein